MKDKKQDAERLADALMMAFGKELGAARERYCQALLDPDQPDPPLFIDEEKEAALQALRAKHSWDPDWDDDWDDDLNEDWGDTLDKWGDSLYGWKDWEERDCCDKVVPARRSTGRRNVLRRGVILAAVLILVMGLALVAAEGVKLKKSTMHMKETVGESTKITDIEKTKFDVEDFRVTYVPEGYELVEDVVLGEFVREICYKKDGIGIWIKISKTEQFGANVDNESAGRTEVLVNDKQAYLFNDGIKVILVWQMGDCTITVSGKQPEEELKSIAKQIYVN